MRFNLILITMTITTFYVHIIDVCKRTQEPLQAIDVMIFKGREELEVKLPSRVFAAS